MPIRLNVYQPVRSGSGASRRLRAWTRRLGVTFAAAPVRRVIQAAALAAFLWLFFYVSWPYGSADYAQGFAERERIEAELFLLLDPLVGISTAIAARAWIFTLIWAGAILAVCLAVPRGFCGYLCPLGTIIDLFDWSIGRRVKRFHLAEDARGWWVHLKYYLLAATLLASTLGLLVAGFFAAIPVVTRGLQFTLAPLQLGVMKGFYLVPPMNAGQWLSIALFAGVLGLGLLRKRFWCRYVCPTGAVFSLGNALRLTQRKVTTDCINCGKCVEVCPFDAIEADYHTRTADCTFCQTCGGVCPTHAIQFVGRSAALPEKAHEAQVDAGAVALSRRSLMVAAAGGAGLFMGLERVMPRALKAEESPVRPPGSVPEDQFLQLCIRCGHCFKACPNNVLQPCGFEHGFDALWTPKVVADFSGCEPSCNNCGQVCPTGAIRALPMEEKRMARMGLAILNTETCLPYAGRGECRLCVDECEAAGYHAMEFRTEGVLLDEYGLPVEGTGRLVPVVLDDLCVGCGLCQTRCRLANVKQQGLLAASAIVVQAGPGREDRLMTGSYQEARRQRLPERPAAPAGDGGYLPDFLQ